MSMIEHLPFQPTYYRRLWGSAEPLIIDRVTPVAEVVIYCSDEHNRAVQSLIVPMEEVRESKWTPDESWRLHHQPHCATNGGAKESISYSPATRSDRAATSRQSSN